MSTAAPTVSVKAWRNAVFATFAANGLAVSALISRMPGIRDHLGIPVSSVGLLITCFSVGALAGLLFAGHLHALIGGRRMVRFALLACALGIALVAVGAGILASYAVGIIGAAIFGCASSCCDLAMNVEGASAERELKRTIMPWYHAAWSMANATGSLIGAGIAALGVDVAPHMLTVAAIVAVAAALIPRWIPRAEPATADAPEPTFRERMAVWLEPRTIVIGLVVFCFAYTEGAANDWLPLSMVDGRGLQNWQGALMLGIFTGAQTVGRIAGAPLVDRFGRVPMMLATVVLAAAGLSLVLFVPLIPVTVIGTILWGLGAALGFPLGMSAAADDPARAAARVSAVATVGYLAFLVGPPAIGFLGQQVGLLNALIAILALIVIGGALSPALRKPNAAAPVQIPVTPGPGREL